MPFSFSLVTTLNKIHEEENNQMTYYLKGQHLWKLSQNRKIPYTQASLKCLVQNTTAYCTVGGG